MAVLRSRTDGTDTTRTTARAVSVTSRSFRPKFSPFSLSPLRPILVAPITRYTVCWTPPPTDPAKIVSVSTAMRASSTNAKSIVNDPESPISSIDEAQKVQERVAIGAKVVYEAVRLEGEEELERTAVALAWSALAAGLS